MSRIVMTRCEGGEHITLTVLNDKGGVERTVPALFSELQAAVPEGKERDEALVDEVKATIRSVEARTFEAMKTAVEAGEFEKALSAGTRG